ncbi:exonuclease domain-containing protein [Bacillus massilinigeriensis]|uniref:exonuclease domain-containing protein n=1 Tax=Bacillus massilionigeriensis TaxID=1805475 RepID=UPI00096AE4EA|nr:exonuclease domain-containing protein [Bacillus massilionigeriensis]
MNMNQMVHFVRQLSGRLSPSMYTSISNQTDAASIAFLRQLQKEIKNEDVLKIPFSELKVIVFDLETTGFFPHKGDRILSIGAVKLEGDQILEDETYYSLVNCNTQLSHEVKELTGICEDDLAKAPPLEKVLKEFYQFIGTCPLVAHHAHHEKSFMKYETWKTLKINFQHRIMDTSFLTKIVEPEKRLITLDDCCKHYGIRIEKRHHALHDAVGTAKLWTESVRQIQNLGYENLSEVYSYLAKIR